MLAVVQIVFTRWSKEFRGGPGATARNRVPEADEFPLPPKRPAEPSYVVHTIKHVFGSLPGIGRLPGPALQVLSAEEPFHAGCLSASWCDQQRLQVDYQWTSDAGMPARYPRRGVLTLQPGQWGRVRYNARIRLTGHDCSAWWYEKWVFNIGLFPVLAARAFLDSEPIKIHSEMELLR
jgi:hypothetical protein